MMGHAQPQKELFSYRERIVQLFARGVVDSPWEQLRAGLVLGGEELWGQARRLIGQKQGQAEAQWTQTADEQSHVARVRELVRGEADQRLQIWARVKLGGERGVDVARAFGYRNGSGVTPTWIRSHMLLCTHLVDH